LTVLRGAALPAAAPILPDRGVHGTRFRAAVRRVCAGHRRLLAFDLLG
jgi:hypothetical protein